MAVCRRIEPAVQSRAGALSHTPGCAQPHSLPGAPQDNSKELEDLQAAAEKALGDARAEAQKLIAEAKAAAQAEQDKKLGAEKEVRGLRSAHIAPQAACTRLCKVQQTVRRLWSARRHPANAGTAVAVLQRNATSLLCVCRPCTISC